MEIYLNNGHAFPVPVAVADHLLGLASHDQLKVLLYVLCHAGESLPAEQIAACCKVQPAAVEEAIVFWQDANVLQAAPPVASVPVQQPAPQQELPPVSAPEPQKAASPAPVPMTNSSRFPLNPSEIAERVRQNPELFAEAEKYAGKPLNHTALKSLVWMHEYLGLSPELILILAAFCAEVGQFTPLYMEKIAYDWQARGIKDSSQAMEDIRNRTDSRSYTGQLMKIFEMHRHPTDKQQSFIDAWHRSGYPVELVRYAYEKTRNQTDDKLSFPYMNSILEAWERDGVRTVAAAQQLDDAFYADKKRQRAQKPAVQPQKPTAAKRKQEDASFDLSDFDKLVNRF
ncbi:MAG: DnaD domain protein [Oscillospiraceae bacterium]|nr:DnaD domain protein [Oscillospiraceae bacterium]